jgi:hypothetical protein
MSKQPEALPPLPETDWNLYMPARQYEPEWISYQDGYTESNLYEYADAVCEKKNAEITRLHALNAELVEALEEIAFDYESWTAVGLSEIARAALKKATEAA